MPAKPLSEGARLVLERVSRVIEANADADTRTIRKRAGVQRERGDAVLDYLLRGGFVEREQVNAEWTYRSVTPYRARNEAPHVSYGASHSTGQGGGG
jgi:hypothetical protein